MLYSFGWPSISLFSGPNFHQMRDLASKISKNFRGWHPRTLLAGGGDPLPHGYMLCMGAQAPRCWDLGLGNRSAKSKFTTTPLMPTSFHLQANTMKLITDTRWETFELALLISFPYLLIKLLQHFCWQIEYIFRLIFLNTFSALILLFGVRMSIWPVKVWVMRCWCDCLERDADCLHIIQLMQLQSH